MNRVEIEIDDSEALVAMYAEAAIDESQKASAGWHIRGAAAEMT